MQTQSQSTETNPTPPKRRHIRRGPDEGNILWKLYSMLGSVRRAEFQQLLKSNGIRQYTFNAHTAVTYRMSKLRAGVLKLYRDFFIESGHDLNDTVADELAESGPAPATAVQQFDQNEQVG